MERKKLTVNLPIRIGEATFGEPEIAQIMDSLQKRRLTMGDKVRQLEKMWAEYCGTKYALLTTSGSCANLLQLSALTTEPFASIPRGSEVITPAVTFGTTVFSIVQAGLKPVFVDVTHDFNIDPALIEKAITRKTRIILPVHMLGGPCYMNEIVDIAEDNGLTVIEDACESHGAIYHGKKVGSFGLSGSFSNYWSHHVTTAGEGGFVTTDDEEMIEAMRCLRGWGQPHQMTGKLGITMRYPNVDSRHFFYAAGYNFKPNELMAGFGIAQMARIENNIAHRRDNFKWFGDELDAIDADQNLMLPWEYPDTRHVSLFYGFLANKKRELMAYLEKAQIETRSIEASNFVTQPAFNWLFKNGQIRVATKLPIAELVDKCGVGFGNHDAVGPAEREYVRDRIEEFYK